MVDKKRIVKLTQRFIRINSENPPGDEFKIALEVERILKTLGLKVGIYEFKKNRTNVIGILRSKEKKSLLISSHLDTVPAGGNWRFPPFKAQIYKNRIYGRGSSDCKGNLAIGIEAIGNTTRLISASFQCK